MKHTDKDLFESVANLAGEIIRLTDQAFPFYKAFAEDVVSGRITDIKEIEWNLDSMLTFCVNDRFLSLYKKILRKICKQHPDVVKDYVDMYYDMYGNDGDDGK